MKDRIRALIRTDADRQSNRRLVRDYLQHYVLYLMFRTKHYRLLAFMGGTALRILFELPRFSQDLDFSLAESARGFQFAALRRDLLAELSAAGYQVSEKPSESRSVLNTFVRFPGLLYELGLTGHADEVLSIKLEVDTAPPAGGQTEAGIVNRYHMMYYVQHHDLATLFAGKMHALCFRRYGSGRDLYDLLWFLTTQRNLNPNLEFLNNAAAQTEPTPPLFEFHNWRMLVAERLAQMDLRRASNEIRPFLERPEEADFLTLDNLLKLLGQ